MGAVMSMSLSACDYECNEVSALTVSKFLISKDFEKHELTQKSADIESAVVKLKYFGEVTISEHCFGCAVQIETPKMVDHYHLQIILKGEGTVLYHGIEQHLNAGEALVVSPDSSFISTYNADCQKLIVRIPETLMRQTAREFNYEMSEAPIEFNYIKQRLPSTGSLINLLQDILQQPSDYLCGRGVTYYNKLLSNAILGTFSCNLTRSGKNVSSQHRLIERIRDYVQGRILQDITIDELAYLCKISRKSLYNLCDRELGMTPASFVRRLKLDRVYLELSMNHQVRNVTEVALKYGFTNLGRFSAQYREHVGELPSQTLRNTCD